MKFSAILPMKYNSQRVPEKNWRILKDKPLFLWILNKLEKIEHINEIIINTDSEILIDKVSSYNCKKVLFHKRSKELEGDDVSMNLIINETLKSCKNEFILQTHTTNPFLEISTIEKCLKEYIEQKNPILTTTLLKERIYDDNGLPVNHDINNLIQTQDLPNYSYENSCLYIFSKEQFDFNKNRVVENSKLFYLDKIESHDIDTEEDFKIAEILAELL